VFFAPESDLNSEIPEFPRHEPQASMDDGEFVRVSARLRQFFDGGFGFEMRFENLHDEMVSGHILAFQFIFAFLSNITLADGLAVCYGVFYPLPLNQINLKSRPELTEPQGKP
jgi:hypothetical protein